MRVAVTGAGENNPGSLPMLVVIVAGPDADRIPGPQCLSPDMLAGGFLTRCVAHVLHCLSRGRGMLVR